MWLRVQILDIQMKPSDQNLRNRHPLTGRDKTLAAGRQIQTMMSRPIAMPTACAKLHSPEPLERSSAAWLCYSPLTGNSRPKLAFQTNGRGTAGTMSKDLTHLPPSLAAMPVANCLRPNRKGAHGGKTSCANLDFPGQITDFGRFCCLCGLW